MPNCKTNGLMLAKQVFFEDLKNDKDFIEYKERTKLEQGYSYGTLIAGANHYVLNLVGPSSQTIISQFLKSLKRKK